MGILKKKFAKGEITKEEFEEKKRNFWKKIKAKKKLLYALLSASFVASIILFLFRNNIL